MTYKDSLCAEWIKNVNIAYFQIQDMTFSYYKTKANCSELFLSSNSKCKGGISRQSTIARDHYGGLSLGQSSKLYIKPLQHTLDICLYEPWRQKGFLSI